jgi:hypothetical protein
MIVPGRAWRLADGSPQHRSSCGPSESATRDRLRRAASSAVGLAGSQVGLPSRAIGGILFFCLRERKGALNSSGGVSE